MKIILFLLIITTSLFANAQKIRVNEVDDFTKDRIIKTTSFGDYGIYEISFCGTNSIPHLQWFSRNVYLGSGKNMKLILLDDNDNQYEYSCLKYDTQFYSFYGDFEKIIGKNIIKCRLQSNGEYLDKEFKGKKQKLFSNYYSCLKSEIKKHYDGVASAKDIETTHVKK